MSFQGEQERAVNYERILADKVIDFLVKFTRFFGVFDGKFMSFQANFPGFLGFPFPFSMFLFTKLSLHRQYQQHKSH